ncbi:GNAT family N-acetyltransferase [Methanobacterium oryzae]|uniref:GNAT family N-acetyltransferase n=1 Tax=Methanobacterium oryzae TaxID=69540 RepID=UPI003D232168
MIFNVRKLKFPQLQKIAYKSEAEIYNDFNIPPLLQTLDEINEEFKNSVFLKAVKNEKIIGSVRGTLINPETCYIGRLIVHPNFQNQGIGTKLMEEIEKIFNECEKFELITGQKSLKNIYIYEKIGYKQFKIEKLTESLNLIYLKKINKNVKL